MKLHHLLLFFSILFLLLVRPNAHVFAACDSLSVVGNQSFADADCTIASNTVDGVDAGTGVTNTAILTFDTVGTKLTINSCATLLVGQIKLESIEGNRGYIALLDAPDPGLYDPCTTTGTYDSGKILIGAPVYITDADSDTYPEDTTLYGSTTTGRQRLATMNATWNAGGTPSRTTDCNDGSASYYATLTCYPDADSDTYYSTTSHSACSGATCANIGESATVGTDCNDGSSDVWITHTQCYADADNDTYTYGLAANTTCLNTSSCATATKASASTHGATATTYTTGDLLNSASASTDCCDTSADVFPGQTSYFNDPIVNATNCPITTANDYDYDCDDVETLKPGTQAATYACTNPCSGCDLDYAVTAGWLTAPPSTCGGAGTYYQMNGSYVSGDCYTVASCATLATGAAFNRSCR